jgi:hypothetical protein
MDILMRTRGAAYGQASDGWIGGHILSASPPVPPRRRGWVREARQCPASRGVWVARPVPDCLSCSGTGRSRRSRPNGCVQSQRSKNGVRQPQGRPACRRVVLGRRSIRRLVECEMRRRASTIGAGLGLMRPVEILSGQHHDGQRPGIRPAGARVKPRDTLHESTDAKPHRTTRRQEPADPTTLLVDVDVGTTLVVGTCPRWWLCSSLHRVKGEGGGGSSDAVASKASADSAHLVDSKTSRSLSVLPPRMQRGVC